MMKARYLLASSVCLAIFAATLYAAEIDLKDVKCILNPKGPAKAETAVDYKGGKVFFCCQNCPKKFSEEPAKFAVKANHQLIQTKQAKQEKCPLSGGPINPEQWVKYRFPSAVRTARARSLPPKAMSRPSWSFRTPRSPRPSRLLKKRNNQYAMLPRTDPGSHSMEWTRMDRF